MSNQPLKDEELSEDETRAIRSLKRVANKWPQSLAMVSMSGCLAIVKGSLPEDWMDGEGVNRDKVVAWIDGIPNDGGDW